MSFFSLTSSWVSIWSADILCDHLFAWASKTHSRRCLKVGHLPLFERVPAASVVRANLVSRVILIFHVNQTTQPLFSTEFSYWAILILLLFISLITIWIGRWRRLLFEYPGSAGAGPRQSTVPCEPLTWPFFSTSPHLGQLWRQGQEEKGRVWAHCMVRWFVGSCYSLSFTSHWPIWLTWDPSWQGRRHREYVVCI